MSTEEDSVKSKVTALTQNFEIVQNDRAALHAQIASSISLLEFLRNELAQSHSTSPQSLNDSTESLLTNATLLEQNINSLQREVSVSQKVHARLANEISELLADLHSSGHSSSTTEILHRIDDLKSCYATLYDLKCHLQSQAQSSTKVDASEEPSLRSQLAAIEAELPALQDQQQQLSSQVSSLKAQASSAADSALQNTRAQLDAEHQRTVTSLQEQIAQQAAKRAAFTQEIDNLRAEADLWASRLSAITAARADATKLASALKEELDQIKQQHEQELAALNATLSANQVTYSSRILAGQPLRAAIADSKSQHDAHAKAIAATSKNVSFLQHQITAVKSQVAAAAELPAASPSTTTPSAAALSPAAVATPSTSTPSTTTTTTPSTSTTPSSKSKKFQPQPPPATLAAAAAAVVEKPAEKAQPAPKKKPAPKKAAASPVEQPKPAPTPVASAPRSDAPVVRPVASNQENEFVLVTGRKAIKEERPEVVPLLPSDNTAPRGMGIFMALEENAESDNDQEEGDEPSSPVSPFAVAKSTTKKTKSRSKHIPQPVEKPITNAPSTRSSSQSHHSSSLSIPSAITDLFKPLVSTSKKTKKLPLLPPGVKLTSKSKQTPIWQNPSAIAIAFVALFLFIWLSAN